jgi:hypothetical protein
LFLLRDGDESLPADGRPSLPAEASALIRGRPLDATIIAVGVDTYNSLEIEPGLVWKTTGTLVMLNAGRLQGALPGLVLTPRSRGIGKATIVRVGDNSSTAMYWRDIMGENRPARGWLMSTRHEWKRHVEKPSKALPTRRLTAKEARRNALEAARDALPYEKERQRAWDRAAAGVLGVSVDVWRHLDDARIEYLPPVTRDILREYRGLNKRVGRVASGLPIEFPWKPWHDRVMEAAGPELAALKASNPKGDLESSRLMREIDALYH